MSSLAEVCTVTFMLPFFKCNFRSLYLHQIYSFDSHFYVFLKCSKAVICLTSMYLSMSLPIIITIGKNGGGEY